MNPLVEVGSRRLCRAARGERAQRHSFVLCQAANDRQRHGPVHLGRMPVCRACTNMHSRRRYGTLLSTFGNAARSRCPCPSSGKPGRHLGGGGGGARSTTASSTPKMPATGLYVRFESSGAWCSDLSGMSVAAEPPGDDGSDAAVSVYTGSGRARAGSAAVRRPLSSGAGSSELCICMRDQQHTHIAPLSAREGGSPRATCRAPTAHTGDYTWAVAARCQVDLSRLLCIPRFCAPSGCPFESPPAGSPAPRHAAG